MHKDGSIAGVKMTAVAAGEAALKATTGGALAMRWGT